MSQEKLTPKDLQFSKTERRILLKHLEKYYVTRLKNWQFVAGHLGRNDTKTAMAATDRHYRLKVKPIELLLKDLGSEFMSHVTTTSIRRTTEIAARSNGTIQSERKTLDYFHRLKRKRNSKV